MIRFHDVTFAPELFGIGFFILCLWVIIAGIVDHLFLPNLSEVALTEAAILIAALREFIMCAGNQCSMASGSSRLGVACEKQTCERADLSRW